MASPPDQMILTPEDWDILNSIAPTCPADNKGWFLTEARRNSVWRLIQDFRDLEASHNKQQQLFAAHEKTISNLKEVALTRTTDLLEVSETIVRQDRLLKEQAEKIAQYALQLQQLREILLPKEEMA